MQEIVGNSEGRNRSARLTVGIDVGFGSILATKPRFLDFHFDRILDSSDYITPHIMRQHEHVGILRCEGNSRIRLVKVESFQLLSRKSFIWRGCKHPTNTPQCAWIR
jgi:hypothetical protein